MSSVVILLGAPGAGKGTQAARLARVLSIPHIATGDLFRENLSSGTKLGQRVKEYMDKGELVPDDVVVDMLFDRVGRPDCADGYVLDGFPRTLNQARVLDERLPAGGVHVVNLRVSNEAIIERAAGRLICRSCGHIHHATFLPPKNNGACDRCGGDLYMRDDDHPDVVKKRLAVYSDQTRPLVDFYEGQGRLHTVDGEKSRDEVFDALMTRVGGAA